jgi:hypothetical protein
MMAPISHHKELQMPDVTVSRVEHAMTRLNINTVTGVVQRRRYRLPAPRSVHGTVDEDEARHGRASS